MLQQLARLIIAVAICVFTSGVAQAVSLGKIEVASGLGEAFYAEIPLTVDAGESPNAIEVDIASAADYRILEIYRDPALNSIRVDVESDSRGTRVELISSAPIDAPFFNLVLRVQQDRATHFKKFPIFLDLPRAAKAPSVAQPLPTVKAVEGMAPAVTSTPAYVAPAAVTAAKMEGERAATTAQEAQPVARGFQPYNGWARIGRYGPMVYGDTITTVAERLRMDDRYSRQQVMVALFEKNRSKFDQDNINLIKAGTYLDVPTAAEVERVTSSQATQLIAEHEKRWKELTRQPRYAAVEEAQRTRYSKRIRIGEEASGAAAAPMGDSSKEQSVAGAGSQSAAATPVAATAADAATTAEVERAKSQIEELNQQNQELQTKLAESEKKLSELAATQAAAPQADATTAAQEQAKKKLELQVARLQAELDAARDQAQATKSESGMGWLTWILGGAVVVLLGAIAFLLRREPKHPAMAAEEDYAEVPAYDRGAYSVPAPQAVEEEVPEIEVEEADVEAAAGGYDFGESTMRISPEDAAGFSDSIPDLTDEDTSEMEAFQEEVEEEPDPNVDYLSEADVYLRYGMEEEAMQQVRMALKQDATNPEAYGKLAQIQRQMGDQQGFDDTVATASSALAGDALERFNSAISELQSGEAEVSSLEDTMPPTEVSDLIGSDADQAAGEAGVDLDSAMSELDGIDFGDVDEAIEEPAAEATEVSAQASDEGLAFDLSDMTAGDVAADSEEISSPEQADFGGGLDFDLSEFELPGGDKAEVAADVSAETSALPETVAMDWSQDTSVDSGELDIAGESGIENMFGEPPAEASEPASEEAAAESMDIGGLDFDFGSFGEDESTTEETSFSTAESDELPVSTAGDEATLNLGESDLDAGIDLSEIEVEAADDFTSTIRTSTMETVAQSDVDFTATGEHDLHMIEEATDSGSTSDSAGDVLDFDFGTSDDVDATQQLEDLLSEFSDEDDKKKD